VGVVEKGRVYKEIMKEERIVEAYKEKKEEGSKEEIEEIKRKIKDHSYKITPRKEKYIKKRKIIESSERDKIIEKVASRVLGERYETEFLESNHGYRKKRSVYTALKEIENWLGVTWFIRLDIRNYYGSINQRRLYEIMKKEKLEKE
jgi:retron-type reverse transcriptase